MQDIIERYLEAWNEPNSQGKESAVKAAEFTNGAYAACEHGYGCTIIAGNFEDNPKLPAYQEEYVKDLHPLPAIWGVHPYYSVEGESEEPFLTFREHLPNRGVGEQIWFTEIGALYCTRGRVRGDALRWDPGVRYNSFDISAGRAVSTWHTGFRR